MASLLLLRPAASGGANRIRFPSIISSFRRGLSSHIDAHGKVMFVAEEKDLCFR
ncbi:hypothetical protein DAI22_08g005150 [Oryza sativa Japonica Group]|nr:hypothetical protein DAI22_08g005150 [Oryza sativa Japonica Group]